MSESNVNGAGVLQIEFAPLVRPKDKRGKGPNWGRASNCQWIGLAVLKEDYPTEYITEYSKGAFTRWFAQNPGHELLEAHIEDIGGCLAYWALVRKAA